MRNDLNVDKLHVCAIVDCGVGAVGEKARAGSAIGLTDGCPIGRVSVLTWGSRLLRRVTSSSLAGEVLAVGEYLELGCLLKQTFCDVFGGNAPLNFITDCRSLFTHLRKGNQVTDRCLNKPFMLLQNHLKEKKIDNFALMPGGG